MPIYRNPLRGFLPLVLISITSPVLAQTVTTTGSITGSVTDPSGAAVQNASVTVTNVATGVKTTTLSNADGNYTVRFLPIGRYTVTVQATGFSSPPVAPFQLEINQTVKLENKLVVGAAAGETVAVNDVAPVLNTSDATLATVFTENVIHNLPLNGRNFQSVALFTPGVVMTDPTGMTGQNAIERSQFSNNLISVNGARGQANNIVLDGVELNEPQNNQVSYNPSPDALQEMRVITGNAPAMYGNANGGNIVAVLKSGTNQFHGSAFAYLQSWRLNANSWGNKHNAEINPKNHYTQTFFGAAVGGPIVRDKLFFFGDYEGIRSPQGGTARSSILTPQMLQGDFSAVNYQLYNTQAYDAATGTFPAFPNNQVPVNNPVAKYLAAHSSFYPAPNRTPQSGTIVGNNYAFPWSGGYQTDQFDAKVDYSPNNRDRISGFYAQSRAGDNLGLRQSPEFSFSGLNDFPTTLLGATWVHTFSPAIVNQATVGFTRTKWAGNVPVDQTGAFGLKGDSIVGIPFGTQRYVGFSGQSIGNGVTTVGNPGAPQLLVDNTYGYADNLTIQRGNHLFTLGVQAGRYQQNFNESQNAGALGTFNYSGQYSSNPSVQGASGFGGADFVFNAVNNEQLQNGGEFGNRQWRIAGYAQDDWKVMPNLTLNLGVRYEYDQPWIEAENRNANVLPMNGGTMEYAHSIPSGAPPGSVLCPTEACYESNYRQVMPRFGFAYQPVTRISVRGGYGATSFFEGNAANQRLVNNPPLVSVFQLKAVAPSATSGGQALDVTKGFATNSNTLSPSGSSFSQWPQHIQPAYIHQWNLTVEGAIGSTASLSVGYVGQSGQHLMDYGNANQFTQQQAYDVQVAYANDPGNLPTSDLTPYYNLGAGTSYAAGNGGGVLVTESRAMSNYNGAQVTFRQREKGGLEYTINYMFSKAMTNAAGNYGVSNVAQLLTFQDYYNSAGDYGVAGDDVRHNFNVVVVYALPYGRGRMFGDNANRIVDELFGGWRLSNSFIAFSGVPVTITSSTGVNTNSASGGLRANHYGPLKIRHRSINNWWGTDPSAIPCTTIGTITSTQDSGSNCAYGNTGNYQFGTAANGTERAPGYYNLDSSLFKDFHTFREQSVGFRADVFNTLNVADYGNPSNSIGSYNPDPTQNGWGVISGVRNQERRFQFALNYKF